MDDTTSFVSSILLLVTLLALVLAVLGVVSGSAAGIKRFHDKNVKKATGHGHDAHDPNCKWWRGDFAGVRLSATCRSCSPLGRVL